MRNIVDIVSERVRRSGRNELWRIYRIIFECERRSVGRKTPYTHAEIVLGGVLNGIIYKQ